jgi:TonB-linked SusC/RagA family outer membrane protein
MHSVFGRLLSVLALLFVMQFFSVQSLAAQDKKVTLKSDARERKIEGKVTDENGQPLPGVTIIVKGTATGTITDVNGAYTLFNVSPDETLIFSFVGLQNKEVLIHNQTIINVKLNESNTMLQEVVAIGYGTQQKKVMTGATVQVKGDDIQKLNTVSGMTALQGLTPGVSITKSDGQPGDGLKVSIRGLGTINNSDPLYVVDGVVVGNIDYLSPSDIQSIDVLKDATAAIYGSRAANGVILVTTKQGKYGTKPSISYDSYVGWQNVYKKADPLNAQEYLMIMNEGRLNSGLLPWNITGTATSLNPADNGAQVAIVPDAAGILAGTDKGTDWLNAITNKNAPIQSHSLNITGGSAMSTYSLGLSYITQDGILGKPVASHYDRYNVRINSDHMLITNKEFTVLKVGENLSYSFNEQNGIAIGDGYSNDIYNCITANPFLPIYDKSGNYSYAIPWDSYQANPIAIMVNGGQNISKNHNLIGDIYTEIQPIKNLVYRSQFSVNMSASSYRQYTPAYSLSPTSKAPDNNTYQSISLGLGWIWDNTLSYKYSFLQHNFSLLVGTSAEKDGLGESVNGSNVNSIFNDFQHAYLSNNPIVYEGRTTLSGSPWGISSILSYFSRFNYDYKETYLLSAIIRDDGSSNFDIGHRWGAFPAFSAGWVMTNESFMQNIKGLDFLKLRGSWGRNGNQSIPPFQYLSTIAFYSYNYVFGTDKTTQSIGAYPNIVPNPDVTWETSEQTDIGLDANFLLNRLIFTFDWYNKATKSWLVQAPLQAVYGTGAPYINGGDIDNRGYEIALSWRDHIGELKYNINANIAYNHNNVTRIANSEGIIHGPTVYDGSPDEWYRAQVGYPVGYFYGYKMDGIFQTEADVKAYVNPKTGQEIMPNAQPGDVKFVDLNGDGQINGNDRTMIGDPHPHYNYGITASFAYKGFDFSVVGIGVSGNQVVKVYNFNEDNDMLCNSTTDILSRWHGPGTSNFMPRVIAGASINTQYFSDLYMQSGAYFRISNITLGYDFKQVFPIIPLQQVRVYVTIQDLYTFTKYTGMDPEVGYAPTGIAGWGDNIVQGMDIGNYPSPRTVMVGVNIKF